MLASNTLCVQGAYVPPRRRQLSGGLLDETVGSLSDTLHNELNELSPRTLQLAMDRWDKDVEQLINAVLTIDGTTMPQGRARMPQSWLIWL